MKFEPEVFISYAHLDDVAPGHRSGWVTRFHRDLEIRAGQLLGKRVRFFRDAKLRGDDVFWQTLAKTLHGTAILVTVVTPGYINSQWTRRELVEFCKAASETGGVHIADKARLFKVIKTPVPIEDHPPELQCLLGYEFFRIDPQNGVPREFEDPDREYFTKVDDVAYDVKQLLDILENDDPRSAFQYPPTSRTVYLAETTFDVRDEYDTIKRDLQQNGHRVLPARALPRVAAEVEEFVREQIGQCDLSIHLIGANYGFVPEGGRESVLEIQGRIAAEKAGSSEFPRLIWIPPGLRTLDDRQASLINELRLDPRPHKGTDLLETPLEELKTVLYSHLKPAAQTKPPDSTAAASSGDVLQVYFIYDKDDAANTAAWKDHLFSHGFEVLEPAFDGDQTDMRELHEQNLSMCDAVLILYGAAGRTFVNLKLNDIHKSLARERSRPLRATGVLIAPPITPEKREFKRLTADTILQSDGFAAAPLDKFLAKIRCE